MLITHQGPTYKCISGPNDYGSNYNCNSQSVPIKGLTDKRNITLTLVISLSGEFLPLQIIYQGKTKGNQELLCKPKPKALFKIIIGLIYSIINPYVVQKCKKLGLKLPASQKALLIWDVF